LACVLFESTAIEREHPLDRRRLVESHDEDDRHLPLGGIFHRWNLVCGPSDEEVDELFSFEDVATDRQQLFILQNVEQARRGCAMHPRQGKVAREVLLGQKLREALPSWNGLSRHEAGSLRYIGTILADGGQAIRTRPFIFP
jgi:hypothetical protein